MSSLRRPAPAASVPPSRAPPPPPACPCAGPCRRSGAGCVRASSARTRSRRPARAPRSAPPAAAGRRAWRTGWSGGCAPRAPRQALELGLVETGADATGVAQHLPARPRLLVVAHQQRADLPACAALARQPPADHELLAVDVLDLQPIPAALAGPVGGVEALGDHSLETVLGGGREEVAPAAPWWAGVCQAGPFSRSSLEQRAPLAVGERDRGAPVEVEQIEDHIGDGCSRASARGWRSRMSGACAAAVARSSASRARRRRRSRRRAPPRARPAGGPARAARGSGS